MTERILVVDDEEDLCEILQYNLEKAGFIVDVAYSAEDALKQDLSVYRLFLLDVMMGEMSGFKLGSAIKKSDETANIPIIYLTAKDTENDKLTGFAIGADDYISKPFSINEVIARVKAVLKRSSQGFLNTKVIQPDLHILESIADTQNAESIGFDKLILNLTNKTAFIGDNEISLTKKEYELLSLFLQKPDTVLSREQLLNSVWDGDAFVLDRTIDVNITRLRKKIVPYDKRLTTRQGYGYFFSTK
ncbi:MAG: response regulator transcription factor [Bacteroidia bacterium]|nr:response regulator transcription factor [Bacteroidia bacterium]